MPGRTARSETHILRLLTDLSCEGPNGCILWTGPLTNDGYGQLHWRLRGVSIRGAHRVSYSLQVGQIPDGLTLDHLCRIRSCINPQHLEPVTGVENIQRMWQQSGRKGQTPRRAFRVPDEVYLPAQQEAKDRGETLTDAVIRFLKGYGKTHRQR